MYAATPSLEPQKLLVVKPAVREQDRRNVGVPPAEHNSSAMIHVHSYRAYFNTQAKPDTHVEVPEEDQTQELRECGRLVKAVYGTRQERGGGTGTAPSGHSARGLVTVFHHKKVDGSGLVQSEEVVTVTCQWHAKEIETDLRDRWDVEVQTFWPGRADIKNIRILNRILSRRMCNTKRCRPEHASTFVGRNLSSTDRAVRTPCKDAK